MTLKWCSTAKKSHCMSKWWPAPERISDFLRPVSESMIFILLEIAINMKFGGDWSFHFYELFDLATLSASKIAFKIFQNFIKWTKLCQIPPQTFLTESVLVVGGHDYGDVSFSCYRWWFFFRWFPPRLVTSFSDKGALLSSPLDPNPPLPSLCVWSLKEWFNWKMTCLVLSFKQYTWDNTHT